MAYGNSKIRQQVAGSSHRTVYDQQPVVSYKIIRLDGH
jgi:hypothetical protein